MFATEIVGFLVTLNLLLLIKILQYSYEAQDQHATPSWCDWLSQVRLFKNMLQINLMTNNLANQNLRLLQALHCEIPFLKKFSPDQLTELAAKSHFFVFSSSTVIAQEKQPIDFLAVILEGKVTVAGDAEKKGAGYFIGELGLSGILDRHAVSIVGDSDGIVLAMRFEDINKMEKGTKAIVHSFAVMRSLQVLKNCGENDVLFLGQQIEQRRVSHLYTQQLKVLLTQHLEPKQKQALLKYFPIVQISGKTKIVDKKDQPFLLILIKGELVIKSQNSLQCVATKILPGEMFNGEGFLLNYSPNVNVYCYSEEAVLIKILRRQAQNLIDTTVQKIDNFLLRKEINDKKYEVLTSQMRREKEKQTSKSGNLNSKWSIFTKQNYEIVPLSAPKKHQKQKPKTPAQSQKEPKVAMSALFREQLQQSKNQKTSSSINSKINKVITMKTEKAEQKSNSLEQQLKDLRKQMEVLSSKVKYYEENYSKCHLEMVEFRAKFQMGAVLKEINAIGDKKFRNKNGTQMAKVMTLKKAFQEHMKENRIMQVVARCAYRWLWAVRKKKGLSKFRSTIK